MHGVDGPRKSTAQLVPDNKNKLKARLFGKLLLSSSALQHMKQVRTKLSILKYNLLTSKGLFQDVFFQVVLLLK